jgi:4-amino-4-deoxy-L-arabinose transferase-like glycosyltransferase
MTDVSAGLTRSGQSGGSGAPTVLDRPPAPVVDVEHPVPAPEPAPPSKWRERAPLLGVTAVSLVLNLWNLSVNALGNQYYSAATRSMTANWHNFFFASFDQGGFISIDKPPVALWIEAISARLFGINSWSILMPSALAGAAAVALLWCIVRRHFGVGAATIAGLVLALSPINVAVDRLNLPEPFLILFLVAAVWAVLRSFDARKGLGWVVLAGVFVGLAFNTKMLAAYIPLPAIGIALLVGTRGWLEKVKRGVVFGVTTLLASAPWIVIVDWIPAASRPFVGGSTNNTVLDLVFGYNGFGRVSGGTAGGGFGGGAPGGGARGGLGGATTGAGGIFGGSAGPFRLFSDAVGGQIAWLIPLAVIGAGAAFWLHRRDHGRRAALVLWAGWLALYGVIFSYAEGTFHSYYTSVLTPAIAALVGIGAMAMLTLLRRSRWWLALIGFAAVATISVELGLADREPTFFGWTRPVLIVAAVAAAIGVVVGLARRNPKLIKVALAGAIAASLIIPTAWAASETTNRVLNSTLPQAGPRTGSSGSSFGSASSDGDPTLAAFLLANNRGETWDLVVSSAQVGSGLIADQGVSVMSLGGFMGTDKPATVSSFADMVAAGQVRYVYVGSRGGTGGGGFGGAAGGGTGTQILNAVSQTCTAVTTASSGGSLPSEYSGSIYDCSGHADAIRRLA